MRDPCGIHVSAEVRGYMQDTYMIHARIIKDTCGIHVSAVVPGYIEDTCGMHQGYIMRDMYLKCMQRGTYLRCKIHARYMYICKGNQDTCKGSRRGCNGDGGALA